MWVGRIIALLLAVMVALVLGYATKAYAAPGDLDPSFSGDGKAATDFTNAFNDSGLDVAVQEDGKIVVAGSVTSSGTGNDFAVARYNANGTPDTTFGSGGQVVTPVGAGSSSDDAYGVAVRSDGKIVAAGFTDNDNSGTGKTDPDFAAVRYNPNGSLDTSFDGDGKVITPVGSYRDYAVDVVVQGKKTILAGRSLDTTPWTYDFALVRYNDNGSLDNTLGSDGIVTTDLFFVHEDDFGEDVAVGPDGKIILAGFRYYSATGKDFALVRYNTDGSRDFGFGYGGMVATHFGTGDDSAYGVVVQEDGKIVVGGKANTGSREDFALARYNTNGSLDDEFDFDGKVTTDFGGAGGWLWDLALQDDGRIVAAGTSSAANSGANFALVRYNTDGSLNSSFSNDGRVMTDFFGYSDEARSVALQENGRIVAAGITYNPAAGSNFALARYFGGDDATAPKTNPPAQALLAGSTLGTSTVPARLSWSATDSEGVVTRYQLQRSADGGAYQNISLPGAGATTVTHALLPGHNYRYRVRATDDNGNTSVWRYGPRFTVAPHQETSTAIAYSGVWKRQALSGSYGGAVKYATARGATAKLTFTGRNVAWVAPKSKARGKAEVYLDGKKVAVVDLYSLTTQLRRVAYAANGLNPSVTHTLAIKVLGTSGRPRVDVDAFVVLR